jgi:hypothetical protein
MNTTIELTSAERQFLITLVSVSIDLVTATVPEERATPPSAAVATTLLKKLVGETTPDDQYKKIPSF